MSFELILVGAKGNSPRLPRKRDLVLAFDGHVLTDRRGLPRSALAVLPGFTPRPGDDDLAPTATLTVGTPDDGESEVSYSLTPEPDPQQTLIIIRSPVVARWLWDATFSLLRDFDLFLTYPGMQEVVVARGKVQVPEEISRSYSTRVVDSTYALISAVTEG